MTTELNAPSSDTLETPAVVEGEQTTEQPKQDEQKPEAVVETDKADADKAASEAAKTLAEAKKRKAEESRQRWNENQRQKYEAIARAEKAEKELAEYRAGLKQPDPNLYDDNARYTADVVQHTLDTNEAKRRESEIAAQKQTAKELEARTVQEKLEDAEERFPGFRNKVIREEVPITGHMAEAMMASPHFAEIGLALAENPREARAIASMSQVEQILEIGRMAERLSGSPPKRITQAPDPIKPVTGGGGPISESDPKKLAENMGAYANWRLAQLKRS